MCDFVCCAKKEEVGLFASQLLRRIQHLSTSRSLKHISLSSVGAEKLCLLAASAHLQRLFQRQLFRFEPRRAHGIAAGFRCPPLILRLSGVVNEQRSVRIRQQQTEKKEPEILNKPNELQSDSYLSFYQAGAAKLVLIITSGVANRMLMRGTVTAP